jgi:flagellar biosynthesis/type III secretory pathway protein FliH
MSDVSSSQRGGRFVFDRVFTEKPFNGDMGLTGLNPVPAPEDNTPQFTAADVDTARQLGYEEGLRQGAEDGRVEGAQTALTEAETRTNAAFTALAEELTALGQRQDEMFTALAQDCERLVHVILDRLLPELVRRGGAEEILGVVRTALSIACNDPVVEVRVPHDVVEGIRPRIARLTRDLAFRGRVDLHGDSFLTDGMVRVRWLHGGAQRDPDQMLTEVTGILARVLEREGTRTDSPAAEAAAPADNERTEK